MPLSIKIHLPTQLTISLGIFTRHVINVLSRAGIDHLGAARGLLQGDNELLPLAGIGSGSSEQGLATGRGEGIAERGEDEEEEEDYDGEEEGGDYV